MRILKRTLYMVYIFLACFLLLELFVRLWGYSDRYIYDPIYQPFPGSKEIPYVHKPCLKSAKARGLALINTDSLGLRSSKSCEKYGVKEPGELRIAIAGDSVTFGEGVKDTKDTYPERLQRILSQKLPGIKVKVFNFGVSAYSVKEMAATLKEKMLGIQPDIVIMAVIPHDFDLGRTGIVDKWGYTIHTHPGSPFSRDSEVRNVLRHIHLLYLLRDLYNQYIREGNPQNRRCGSYDEVPASYKYVKIFVETAKKNHIKYAVVLLPSLDREFSRRFKKQLKHDNIVVLDTSLLKDEFSMGQFMASPFDAHPSAAVHKAIAQKIANFILTNLLPMDIKGREDRFLPIDSESDNAT